MENLISKSADQYITALKEFEWDPDSDPDDEEFYYSEYEYSAKKFVNIRKNLIKASSELLEYIEHTKKFWGKDNCPNETQLLEIAKLLTNL